MRRNNTLLASVALAAVTALLGACSESNADPDDKADERPSSSEPDPTEASSAPIETSSGPTDETPLPAGVLPLPERDPGSDFATLAVGRYRVPLDETLAFEIDLPADTAAHDNGLFLATDDFVVKTEIAGEDYGVPQDPCTAQTIEPVGPTVGDLVTAIADLPVYRTTPPEDVELGGAEGAYIEARIPRSYDASQCDEDAVQLPGNPETTVSGPPPYLGRWWILDVDGQRVVVQQNCWGCDPDQFGRGLRTPESITFTPTS